MSLKTLVGSGSGAGSGIKIKKFGSGSGINHSGSATLESSVHILAQRPYTICVICCEIYPNYSILAYIDLHCFNWNHNWQKQKDQTDEIDRDDEFDAETTGRYHTEISSE